MKNSLFIVASFLLLFSCRVDELKVEDWKPIAAIPLAYSNFDVYDVLTRTDSLDELLVFGTDGLMALNYKGELFSLRLDEILDLPDQSISQPLSFSESEADLIDSGIGLSSSFNIDTPLETDPEGIRIDEIVMLGGSFEFTYTIIQDEVFSGSLTLSNILNANSNPLSFVISSVDTEVGVPETVSFDLTGASILPTWEDPDNVLNIDFEFDVTDNPDNDAIEGDALDINISILQPEMDYIVGYFGQIPINTDRDSVSIRIFDNGLTGTFALEEAFIDLNIENSFGLPVAFDLTEVSSLNLDSGEETDLIFPNDLELQGQATLNGPPEEAVFAFDNNNTNVIELFEPSPKTIFFQLNASANPNGEPPIEMPNFIKHDSRLDVEIDVLLPLNGYAQDLLFIDTLSTELSFDEYAEIDSLEFKLASSNGFPISADAQILFLNENNDPLDSLFTHSTAFFASGDINADGIVQSPGLTTVFATLDNEKAANLDSTEKVVIRVLANTTNSSNQQIVRFMEDYSMDVRLGVKIYGNIEQ